MTSWPLLGDSLELLARGHGLYTRVSPTAAVVETPPEQRTQAAWQSPRSRRLAAAFRRTAVTDSELGRLLSAARADHAAGHSRTRAVLDDAHAERAAVPDTPLARREAERRMAARLRAQRRHIARSRRHAHRLARDMGALDYRRAVPTAAVRYRQSARSGEVRQYISDALDRMGISDPRARRNWTRGYETLIARESSGRVAAVAAAPAADPGPVQCDGHGLGYARGLTQTIPATFARYHQPATAANIYDPVANICASMNYVMHRYGVSPDGADLRSLVQQADPHRPPKGY